MAPPRQETGSQGPVAARRPARFPVRCFSCGESFDFFDAAWCTRHRLGAHSKVCPGCGRCACGSKSSWAEWRLYQRELSRYGRPKGIDWRRFAVDAVSVVALWVLIWSAVYILTGVPADKILPLLVWVVVLNLAAGGFQGRWMDLWRRVSRLE